MQQQINLFKFVAKPIQTFLDVKTLLSIYGIVFAALFLLSGIESLLVHHQHTNIQNLEAQVNKERARLIELAKKYPESAFSEEIIDSSKLSACKVKFSTYLTSFAEAIVPGVWLTQFKISDNGKDLDLIGHGYSAGQIQTYLDNLKKLKNFQGYKFNLENITQATPAAAAVITPANDTGSKVKHSPPPKALSFSIDAKAKANG